MLSLPSACLSTNNTYATEFNFKYMKCLLVFNTEVVVELLRYVVVICITMTGLLILSITIIHNVLALFTCLSLICPHLLLDVWVVRQKQSLAKKEQFEPELVALDYLATQLLKRNSVTNVLKPYNTVTRLQLITQAGNDVF